MGLGSSQPWIKARRAIPEKMFLEEIGETVQDGKMGPVPDRSEARRRRWTLECSVSFFVFDSNRGTGRFPL